MRVTKLLEGCHYGDHPRPCWRSSLHRQGEIIQALWEFKDIFLQPLQGPQQDRRHLHYL